VTQNLNILFIVTETLDNLLKGDYLRDRAYKEAKPIVSRFDFNPETKELLMKTNYSQVVSVDSILNVNQRTPVKFLNIKIPTEINGR
jgi:hypothetical protein